MFHISDTSIGLDISDESIEVVELKKIGRRIQIVSKNRVRLPLGIVSRGNIKNKEELGKILIQLFAEAKPQPIEMKQCICALPESQVYTHAVFLKEVSERHVDEFLPGALAKVVPLPEESIHAAWRIIKKTKEGVHVLAVAADREIVRAWQEFFSSVGITLEAFDIEPLALYRDVVAGPLKESICMIDVGARTVQYSFFTTDGLRYTQTGHYAGSYFTSSLESLFEHEGDAEKYKRTEGLRGSNSKATAALSVAVDTCLAHIEKTVTFFESTKEVEVSEIIFVGGSMRLPGLIEYIDAHMKKPHRVGTSLRVEGTDFFEYLGAVGMALRGIETKWKKQDIALPLVTQKKKEKNIALRQDTVVGEGNREKTGHGATMQFLILLFVVLIGGGAVLWAFSYRNAQRSAEKEKQSAVEQGTFAELDQAIEDLETFLEFPTSTDEVVLSSSTVSFVTSTVSSSSVSFGDMSQVVVEVLDTGIGYVNVRSGPATRFEVIQQVPIGIEFVLLEEREGWSNIVLSASTTGWVSSRYLRIVEEDS